MDRFIFGWTDDHSTITLARIFQMVIRTAFANKCYDISTDRPGEWATIIIRPNGQIFINSDYGDWCFWWNGFGKDFKQFLISLNSDYLASKLGSNRQLWKREKPPQQLVVFIERIWPEFIQCLKEEIQRESMCPTIASKLSTEDEQRP